MSLRVAGGVVLTLGALAALGWWHSARQQTAEAVAMPAAAGMPHVAIGHEFRQDDWPAIAASPDGSLWAAWLSYVGDRDDVAIRHFSDGKWGNIQWVPGTSGDSWMPQVAVDGSGRVWVVWAGQVQANWDLYARSFDPPAQQWGAVERLTDDPLPDIDPRMASDGRGHLALVWQGFRGKNSNIFLKTFDGKRWSGEVRVTHRAANDWQPAVAPEADGTAWVAYDSYKNGNYDVFLARVRDGKVEGGEVAVAATPRFEARATVALDSAGRVWVAWEEGLPNWGKDQGYILSGRQVGVPLGGKRQARVRCFDHGKWLEPVALVAAAFHGSSSSAPHVFSDGRGSVWVAASVRTTTVSARQGPADFYHPPASQSFWEYQVTHLDGDRWRAVEALPSSKGRSSTRVNAALGADQKLWLVWPTDNRSEMFYHRPLRQQVYAGWMAAPEAAAPVLRAPGEERVEEKAGHTDEAADLRAIRAYTAAAGEERLHILRGDFHRHTEFSLDRGGEPDGSLQDFYRYMIDAAAMDFGASTDHQGGSWPYWRWLSQKMTDLYHVPGAYAAIFGYERSAVYPDGHRNVFFARRSESRVTPFFLKEGAQGFAMPISPQGDEPPAGTGELVANDTRLLYEDIRPRHGLAISHTSATRMGTDWRDNDPDLEPVVEIFQWCRVSYEQDGAPLVAKTGRDDFQMKLAGHEPKSAGALRPKGRTTGRRWRVRSPPICSSRGRS